MSIQGEIIKKAMENAAVKRGGNEDSASDADKENQDSDTGQNEESPGGGARDSAGKGGDSDPADKVGSSGGSGESSKQSESEKGDTAKQKSGDDTSSGGGNKGGSGGSGNKGYVTADDVSGNSGGGKQGGDKKDKGGARDIMKKMKMANNVLQATLALHKFMMMMKLLQLLKMLLQMLMMAVQAVVNAVVTIIATVMNVLAHAAAIIGITMAVMTGGIFAFVAVVVVSAVVAIGARDASEVANKEPVDPCDEYANWTMGEDFADGNEIGVVEIIYAALRTANPAYDQYHIAAIAGNFFGESDLMPSRREQAFYNTDTFWADVVNTPDCNQYKDWLEPCVKCDCQCVWWSWATIHPGSWATKTETKCSTCGNATKEVQYHTSSVNADGTAVGGDMGIQCYQYRTRSCTHGENGGVGAWSNWTWKHASHLKNMQAGCIRQAKSKGSTSFAGDGGYRGIGLGQWTAGRHRNLMAFAYGSASRVYNGRCNGNIFADMPEHGTATPIHEPVNGKTMHWYATELQMALLIGKEGSDSTYAMQTFPNKKDSACNTNVYHKSGVKGYAELWMREWERPNASAISQSIGTRAEKAEALLNDCIGTWYDNHDTGLPTLGDISVGQDILSMAETTAEDAANLGSATNRNGCSKTIAANNSDIAHAAISFAMPHKSVDTINTACGHTAAHCSKGTGGTPLYQCVANTCYNVTAANNRACTYVANSALMWSGATDKKLNTVCESLIKDLATYDEFMEVDWGSDKSKLQPGDVLICETHIVLYVGHDTIVSVYGSNPDYACAVANTQLEVVAGSISNDSTSTPGSRSAGLETYDAGSYNTAKGYKVFRNVAKRPNPEYVGACKEGYSSGY